ncbi:putative transposable element encoded protein [Trachipleistophora hominis]|uniref:Putative transposable element encoded protein n=1 Tax=Trachipleistophora hominis TaxID=72359 RepID=L7JTL4_TRAHO|nr:putative transposable element encoded protein [Trachipleistophora hominis]
MAGYRIAPVQKIIDKTVSDVIVSPANFCWASTCEELRSESIEVEAAKAKVRTFTMWIRSRTLYSK